MQEASSYITHYWKKATVFYQEYIASTFYRNGDVLYWHNGFSSRRNFLPLNVPFTNMSIYKVVWIILRPGHQERSPTPSGSETPHFAEPYFPRCIRVTTWMWDVPFLYIKLNIKGLRDITRQCRYTNAPLRSVLRVSMTLTDCAPSQRLTVTLYSCSNWLTEIISSSAFPALAVWANLSCTWLHNRETIYWIEVYLACSQ